MAIDEGSIRTRQSQQQNARQDIDTTDRTQEPQGQGDATTDNNSIQPINEEMEVEVNEEVEEILATLETASEIK